MPSGLSRHRPTRAFIRGKIKLYILKYEKNYYMAGFLFSKQNTYGNFFLHSIHTDQRETKHPFLLPFVSSHYSQPKNLKRGISFREMSILYQKTKESLNFCFENNYEKQVTS